MAKFMLDTQTGEILGWSSAMDQEQYKGRFVPWEGPIPEGGRVDLMTWQSRKDSEQVTLGAELAAFAAEQAKPKVLPEVPQPPAAPRALSIGERYQALLRAVQRFTDGKTHMFIELNRLVDEEENRIRKGIPQEAPAVAASPAPMGLTDECRQAKIQRALETLKGQAFTETGEPNLDVISGFCGFEVKALRQASRPAAMSSGEPAIQRKPEPLTDVERIAAAEDAGLGV